MNVSFFGRLTRDPEQKTSQDGRTTYTLFSVATTVRAKGEDNKNKSIFVNVTAFGNASNVITQYFHKGSRIVVHGEINDISIWTGQQDGQAHASTNVNMTGFDFVDTQAESGNQQQQQGYGNAAPYGNAVPNNNRPPANNGYTAPNNNRPPAAPNYGAPNNAPPNYGNPSGGYGAPNTGYAAPNNGTPNNSTPNNTPW